MSDHESPWISKMLESLKQLLPTGKHATLGEHLGKALRQSLFVSRIILWVDVALLRKESLNLALEFFSQPIFTL
jgi:hypothetical protein